MDGAARGMLVEVNIGKRLALAAVAMTLWAAEPPPAIHSFWQTSLERDSRTGVTLRMDFAKRPAANRIVTVLPLGVPLAPTAAKITKVEQSRGGCEAGGVSWTGTVSVDAPEYQTAPAAPNRRDEMPFDAVLIYPAVPSARAISPEKLTAGMLPRGALRSTVSAAIDLTGDGTPDLLVSTFCCSDPKTPLATCDYHCARYFERRGGTWVQARRVRPC